MTDQTQLSKSYLIEGQLMHLIKKSENRQKELERMYNATPREITEESYKIQSAMCYGATTQLMICLTCYDNPLSNFLSEEKKK